MSNKVEIAGQTFSFVGTFIASTHEQLETRIRAQGGEVVASPTPQTDYIVTGANPVGTKFNKVLALGVPMLGEQDIEDLLAGEDVFLGEDDDHEDANALFGEAREWLHRTEPSAKLWQDLTEVLDRCPVNQQAALVSYIDSFFSAWHADGSMASLIGYPIDLESVRHTRVEDGYWRYGVPGELRVAPEHWVGELMQGKRSPKLRLIRALDLVWSDMNSRDVGAVLAHPDLTCIDTLNLSLSKQLTRQLIRTLCASPTRDKLERLMFGQLHPRNSIWWLEASDAPGALQYLDTSQYSALISFRFLEAPYFQNLTGLSLIGEQMDSMRRSLDHGLEVDRAQRRHAQQPRAGRPAVVLGDQQPLLRRERGLLDHLLEVGDLLLAVAAAQVLAPEVGQEQRGLERMLDEGLSRQPELAIVRLFGEAVGLCDDVQFVLGEVSLSLGE